MRILIAIPTSGVIETVTFKSIYNLDIPKDCEVSFDVVSGYGAARARNLIAQKCIDGGFDGVLMVDADMDIPQNALNLCLEGNEPIVLGTYPRRGDASVSELFRATSSDFTDQIKMIDLPFDRLEVKGGGMGCALIRRSVFESLKYPWFSFVEYQNRQILSEDLYFCDKSAKNGLKIIADGRVRCGHITKYIARG